MIAGYGIPGNYCFLRNFLEGNIDFGKKIFAILQNTKNLDVFPKVQLITAVAEEAVTPARSLITVSIAKSVHQSIQDPINPNRVVLYIKKTLYIALSPCKRISSFVNLGQR